MNSTQELLEKEETGDVIHKSSGLQVRRRHNGFVAIRLHYSADPNKDAAWAEQTKREMSDDQRFEREYEINFDTIAGKPVFGMWDDGVHIVHLPDAPPPDAALFMGTDSGWDKPASTVWIYLDGKSKHPDHYIYRENYISRMGATDYARMTLSQCGKEVYAGRWADPSIWEERQGTGTNSVGMQFAQAGFRPAPALGRDDYAAVALWAQMFSNSVIRARGVEPNGPCAYISSNCPNTIREFKNLSNSKTGEKITGANHAWDGCKYVVLSNPRRVSGKDIAQVKKNFSSFQSGLAIHGNWG